MLKWCAYCQHFLGEIKSFNDFASSHGICACCSAEGIERLEKNIEHSKKLKAIQAKLINAGKTQDMAAAELIVEEAIAAQVRPIDILMGLTAPLLYQIGEDWKKGTVSIEEEQRFSAVAEAVFQLVQRKILKPEISIANQPERKLDALLINAFGNHHTLAIRTLCLWFEDQGLHAQAIYPCPNLVILETLIKKTSPRYLIISLALAEQRPGVVEIADFISKFRKKNRPQVIVGGNAVKLGEVQEIPGATLLNDINSLSL